MTLPSWASRKMTLLGSTAGLWLTASHRPSGDHDSIESLACRVAPVRHRYGQELCKLPLRVAQRGDDSDRSGHGHPQGVRCDFAAVRPPRRRDVSSRIRS